MDWLNTPAKKTSDSAKQAATERQAILTKPPGSLGQLEDAAISLAALQDKPIPCIDKVMIRIFAGDHGVVEEGVSAFPRVVTGEMIKNFAAGGAAISVLAKHLNADFGVLNMGTVVDLDELSGVESINIAKGTANFCRQAAMSDTELSAALEAGKQVAEVCHEHKFELFIGGEMGIGNTTSASALCTALTDRAIEHWVGKGTGVDSDGIERKKAAISKAIKLHQPNKTDALEVLRCLGGLEIAGLVSCYIRCAQVGVPVLVDGFISTAAALVACKINPSIRSWLLFSHCSDEAGHKFILEELDATPLIQLGMRLGEGSGAAVATPLLQTACRLHKQMATFEQAGVSNND